MCFENTYGSICHDLWNENDAQIVCRQLGFSSENTTALRNAFYNSSSGPIYLNSVQCEGDELVLENCTWSRDTEDCTHRQDAGVSCLGMYVILGSFQNYMCYSKKYVVVHKTISRDKNDAIYVDQTYEFSLSVICTYNYVTI